MFTCSLKLHSLYTFTLQFFSTFHRLKAHFFNVRIILCITLNFYYEKLNSPTEQLNLNNCQYSIYGELSSVGLIDVSEARKHTRKLNTKSPIKLVSTRY